MVVVDSSALIPLARVGRLDLIPAVFDEILTTGLVEDEVVVDGQPGSSALQRFLEDASTVTPPEATEEVADLEGIAVADAAVVLLADRAEDILLANDKGLIAVARSHDVDCWWVTTLLLSCVKEGVLDTDEATEVLYDLVEAGMNFSPQVYAQVRKELEEIGE